MKLSNNLMQQFGLKKCRYLVAIVDVVYKSQNVGRLYCNENYHAICIPKIPKYISTRPFCFSSITLMFSWQNTYTYKLTLWSSLISSLVTNSSLSWTVIIYYCYNNYQKTKYLIYFFFVKIKTQLSGHGIGRSTLMVR